MEERVRGQLTILGSRLNMRLPCLERLLGATADMQTLHELEAINRRLDELEMSARKNGRRDVLVRGRGHI